MDAEVVRHRFGLAADVLSQMRLAAGSPDRLAWVAGQGAPRAADGAE